MSVIETSNLVKKFGTHTVVDKLNIRVEEGDIYGILGPNGAGKSTTINMICGLLKPTSGNISLFGKKIDKVKDFVGFVPQNIALYDEFTAYENLKFFGSIYGIDKAELNKNIDEALEFTGLSDSRDKKAKTFSGGMMRRLNIGCALVHKPKVIIMDEPTVGIDPQSRNHIMRAIRKMNDDGITIVYTSHYMEEIEYLCNRISIIDHGKVIANGTKEELKNIVTDKTVLNVKVLNTSDINTEKISTVKGVLSVNQNDNQISITSEKGVNNFNQVMSLILETGLQVIDIGYSEVTLESVFLALTGRALRE